MASTDDVFDLLNAVNGVTLKRMENKSDAINQVTLKRLEDKADANTARLLERCAAMEEMNQSIIRKLTQIEQHFGLPPA